jgi:replication factor A1
MATAQENGAASAKRKPVFIKVEALKPGTAGHTLTAKVLSSKSVLHKGSVGARATKISECMIGDETGCILFTARNEQGMGFDSIGLVIYRASV